GIGVMMFLTGLSMLLAPRFADEAAYAEAVPPAAAKSGQQAEPRSLFNGKDLAGWHADVPELDNNPQGKSPFIVRDGKLVSLGNPGGHLITDDEFQNYRLVAEYRFVDKPGNCGVLVHASKPRVLYGMFPQSLEVQMQSGEAGDFLCIHEDIAVPNMDK